jgi:V8-like Glu-specific endopeptidase
VSAARLTTPIYMGDYAKSAKVSKQEQQLHNEYTIKKRGFPDQHVDKFRQWSSHKPSTMLDQH